MELFAQTQQLIMGGGRDPSLRDPTTIGALDALVSTQRLECRTRDELVESYCFLRTVEHRLQMLNDDQTQTLPSEPSELERLARFCGFQCTASFSERLMNTLQTVNRNYTDLFADTESLASEDGNLVFTGTEDDPETLKTLSEIGFENPTNVTRAIRAWHYGRFRSTQSSRSGKS